MKQALSITLPENIIDTSQTRLTALDVQRGLIMALMALSHCHELIGQGRYSNNEWNESAAWLGLSGFDLFSQALSSAGSGGFFLMMGMGSILLLESRLKQGWTIENACRYLITRGSLFIFLQLTVLQFFEIMVERELHFYMGVLFALGSCLIFASLLIFSSYKIKELFKLKSNLVLYISALSFMVGIPLFIQFMAQGLLKEGLSASNWQMLLFLGGKFHLGGLKMDIDFTPIPWFPAVAMGIIAGQIMVSRQRKAFGIFGKMALFFLATWILLRLGNMNRWFSFGDYKIFSANDLPSFASLFTMCKYPPSISFFFWSFGLNMALLSFWNGLQSFIPWKSLTLNFLETLGRSALFFYVAHWFVYYAIGLFLPSRIGSMAQIMPFFALGLAMLYLLCRRFNAFKYAQPKGSLWRMF